MHIQQVGPSAGAPRLQHPSQPRDQVTPASSWLANHHCMLSRKHDHVREAAKTLETNPEDTHDVTASNRSTCKTAAPSDSEADVGFGSLDGSRQ